MPHHDRVDGLSPSVDPSRQGMEKTPSMPVGRPR